jgi:GNAT superfamily N-acetyltransferase
LCSIREAAASDAGSIAGLISKLGYPTLESDMIQRLARVQGDSSYRTLVAEVGASVVGMVGCGLAPYYERNGVYCRLLVLAVDERLRRNGIEQALIQAAEQWAAEQGASAMLVNSAHRRRDAHGFYERAGYRSTGVRFVKKLGLPCST